MHCALFKCESQMNCLELNRHCGSSPATVPIFCFKLSREWMNQFRGPKNKMNESLKHTINFTSFCFTIKSKCFVYLFIFSGFEYWWWSVGSAGCSCPSECLGVSDLQKPNPPLANNLYKLVSQKNWISARQSRFLMSEALFIFKRHLKHFYPAKKRAVYY